MRCAIAVFLAMSAAGTLARGESPKPSPWDWAQWRNLPVQDGGRQKPLDTLAWETCRTLSNRTSFADPQTGEPLDCTALYLVMLLEWPGWDRPVDPQATDARQRAGYFASGQPDKWDISRLLLVDSLELRRNLGMSQEQKYISPWKLSQAKIRDPKTGAETLFIAWAERQMKRKQQGRTPLERKSLELADRYWSYQDLRMGLGLAVLPVPASEAQDWLPVFYLVQAPMLSYLDPGGQMSGAAEQLRRVRAAYLARSPAAFNQASAEFLATVRSLGPKLGAYPRQKVIDLEVAYNHWAPFRFAWIFTLTAALAMLMAMGTRWKVFYLGALGFFAAGTVAMFVGFGMRVAISGRAPVTDMYESVIYVGLGTALFGLVFELIYRKRYILAAAACISTLALIMADNCPAHLDATIHPLEPALRSNYWLILHVMTITLSYAAFALALGIANITLGYFLVRSKSRETIAALSRFTYQVLQVGVLLLAAGTILGAVWADYAWGRFWSWDPKEVWALIALLGYLAVLHARKVNWLGHFGLATAAVACFSLVVVAWYGVNFVMGAGRHTYGSGGGGEGYVGSVLAIQFLYVALAALRSRRTPSDPALDPSTPRRDLACASG